MNLLTSAPTTSALICLSPGRKHPDVDVKWRIRRSRNGAIKSTRQATPFFWIPGSVHPHASGHSQQIFPAERSTLFPFASTLDLMAPPGAFPLGIIEFDSISSDRKSKRWGWYRFSKHSEQRFIVLAFASHLRAVEAEIEGWRDRALTHRATCPAPREPPKCAAGAGEPPRGCIGAMYGCMGGMLGCMGPIVFETG